MTHLLDFRVPTADGEESVQLRVPYTARVSHEPRTYDEPGGTFIDEVRCDWTPAEALAALNDYLGEGVYTGTGDELLTIIDEALWLAPLEVEAE